MNTPASQVDDGCHVRHRMPLASAEAQDWLQYFREPKAFRHRKSCRWIVALLAVLATGGASSCSCQGASLAVNAADYGDRWPYLGFKGGILHCYPATDALTGVENVQEITIVLGDTEYGVNGTALARFPDPHKFVLRNQFDTFDFKAMAGMDDLMTKGRALCTN